MEVKDIVKEYLIANGYTGLVGDECGCDLDDLFTCCDFGKDCKPGHACTIKPRPDYCDVDSCMLSKKDNQKCWMDDEDLSLIHI